MATSSMSTLFSCGKRRMKCRSAEGIEGHECRQSFSTVSMSGWSMPVLCSCAKSAESIDDDERWLEWDVLS
jgi:hypothetical protein